ncbi:MAG: hypothetical protein AMXMBFR44_3490 [Candidatus Campbellbacteria bacterium]
MLKIRLQRYGRTNDPSFRVVVLEGTRGPKAGNHVDQIGFYNAVTKQKSLDTEKAKYWISKGAQPSDTVYNMLVTAGAVEGKKRNVLPKKTPIVKEQPVEETAAPETPVAEAPAEAPTEETPAPETPAEEAPVAEVAPEAPTEEVKEEAPAEEPKAE